MNTQTKKILVEGIKEASKISFSSQNKFEIFDYLIKKENLNIFQKTNINNDFYTELILVGKIENEKKQDYKNTIDNKLNAELDKTTNDAYFLTLKPVKYCEFTAYKIQTAQNVKLINFIGNISAELLLFCNYEKNYEDKIIINKEQINKICEIKENSDFLSLETNKLKLQNATINIEKIISNIKREGTKYTGDLSIILSRYLGTGTTFLDNSQDNITVQEAFNSGNNSAYLLKVIMKNTYKVMKLLAKDLTEYSQNQKTQDILRV